MFGFCQGIFKDHATTPGPVSRIAQAWTLIMRAVGIPPRSRAPRYRYPFVYLMSRAPQAGQILKKPDHTDLHPSHSFDWNILDMVQNRLFIAQ
jgi:hypothetical protein